MRKAPQGKQEYPIGFLLAEDCLRFCHILRPRARAAPVGQFFAIPALGPARQMMRPKERSRRECRSQKQRMSQVSQDKQRDHEEEKRGYASKAAAAEQPLLDARGSAELA